MGPGEEDITWPDQVAPWGRKASGTRKIKPQTSNLRHAAPRRPQPSRAHATTAVKRDLGRQTTPSQRRRMAVETAPLAGKLAAGRAKSRGKARGSTAITPGVAGRGAPHGSSWGQQNDRPRLDPKSKKTAGLGPPTCH